MKTRAITWIAAFALAGVCVGQQSDEEAEFNARVSVSKAKAVAIYPDVTNSQSRLVGRMKEIDQKLKAEESDLHYSPDKPFVLAEMAAKDLGIAAKPVVPEPEMVMDPESGQFRSKAFMHEDEVIPEFLSFRSVRVRKVEPDGLKIVHESGAAKIPIEQLSQEQRTKYGITPEGAAQFRKQVAANTAAYYTQQREAAIQAQANSEASEVAAQAAAEQEAENRANRPIAQAPVWKRFSTNTEIRKRERAGIVDEIRRQDGDAAADRFLMEERLKDLEQAQQSQQDRKAPSSNQMSYLEGGKYQKRGNVITSNGNFGGGYAIDGDSLTKGGSVTHKKSGSMWMPVKPGEKQIYDP